MFYTLGYLLPQVLAFCLLPIFTAYLSREDYGIVNYTNAVGLYLQQFSLLGFNTFLLRHHFLCKNEDESRRLFGTSAVFLFLFGLAALGLSLAITPRILAHYQVSIPYYPYFPLAYIALFFENFTILPLIAFRVREKALSFILVNVTKIFAKYLLSLYLIINLHMGVLGKFYAELAINLLFFFLYFYLMRKYFTLSLDLKIVKKGIIFSIPFLTSAVLYQLVDNSDRFFLERTISLGQLGVFSIAVTFYSAFSGLTQSMYRALEPTLYRSYKDLDFNDRYFSIKRVFFLVALACGLFASIFIRDIVLIMTNSRFVQAAEIVPILLLVAVIFGYQTLNTAILTAHGKIRQILFMSILGASLTLLLNAILIPHWEAWGVGFAKVIAFSIMGIVSGFLVSRCGLSQWSGDIRIIGAIIITALTGYLLVNVLHFSSPSLAIVYKMTAYTACMTLVVRVLGFNLKGLFASIQGLFARQI
jgi:O-antigen/teichoic acid export membrane protein